MTPADRLDEVILDSLMGMSPLGIAVLDRDLRYVRINAPAAAANGLPSDAHLGRSVREIVRPDVWAIIEPLLRRVTEQGESFSDLELPVAVDPERVMLSSAWPLRGTDGEILGVVVTRRDITAMRRITENLRESEERFRAVVELAPNCVFIVDEGEVTYANAMALRMSGAAGKAELIGHPLRDRFVPESWDDVQALMRSPSAEDGPAAPRPLTLRRLDGGSTAVDVSVVPTTLGGRPVQFLVIRDVSRQRRAEEELRRRSRFVETLLEHLPLGLAVNEISTGRQLYIGTKFERTYGVEPGSIEGVDDFFEKVYRDPIFREQMRTRIMADLMSGDIDRMHWEDIPITTASGEQRVISASNIPLPEQDLMISTVQDVTDRKREEDARLRLQAQVEQIQRMESVGRLAGGVAHDFNNMLGVILASAELALMKVAPSDPLYEELVEIRKSAERSAALTRQLLAFARRQHADPVVLDLNDTVAGEMRMLQRLLGESVDVTFEPADSVWPVKVDPTQVASILTNLALNARHAIADVGHVTIATGNCSVDAAFCEAHVDAAPGEYVCLSVRDTGRGMDEATRARIFEPFFTTKALGEGTGLGLASVYGAVRQNEGFITVESEPGAGAVFAIYLPRFEGEVPPRRPVEPAVPVSRGHETILVVEDEPALLRLAQRVLQNEGYEVLAASGPVEALRIASEHPGAVHLLLADLVMPVMNGRDLAAALLELLPTLRPVFMSGHAADVFASRGAFQHGAKFLQKPFDTRTLLATVRSALDGV
ncbi:MAG TPA: PAS domain-containing protein [Gemmatimonadaceae bacterium]|jgi:PAS domain S-box-containing protein